MIILQTKEDVRMYYHTVETESIGELERAPQYNNGLLNEGIEDDPIVKCNENGWMCQSKSQCIDKSKRCDGFINCQDASDEICYEIYDKDNTSYKEILISLTDTKSFQELGSICWSALDSLTGHILCQQMGFTTILGFKALSLLESVSLRLIKTSNFISSIRCIGDESTIQKCLIYKLLHPCPVITTVSCGPCFTLINISKEFYEDLTATVNTKNRLTSPGFPTIYFPHINCRWILFTTSTKSMVKSSSEKQNRHFKIQLDFLDLFPASVSGCENGYLRFHLRPLNYYHERGFSDKGNLEFHHPKRRPIFSSLKTSKL
ncbi:unnamed protein product [Gordionus sp. m RMFG-2023]